MGNVKIEPFTDIFLDIGAIFWLIQKKKDDMVESKVGIGRTRPYLHCYRGVEIFW